MNGTDPTAQLSMHTNSFTRLLALTFVAQYKPPPAYASCPATELMLTMWPRLRATMPGANMRVNSATPATFVCSIVFMSCMQ